jgi:hypothetical protein
MTSADNLSLALPPVEMDAEDARLEDRMIRLELLVEVVLADAATDWDDSAAKLVFPVAGVWPDTACNGPTHEMLDVPTESNWLMFQLLRFGKAPARAPRGSLAKLRPMTAGIVVASIRR